MSERTPAELRDLLLPSLAEVENTLGLEHYADLLIDDAGLYLEIRRGTRSKQYRVSDAETWLARVREAFADFLMDEGVTGVREFLERRGPRE